ncbi:MAG: hypothetical protein K2P81_01260 [Bacteriovoracaceae bacterium]|nr:hypothetical protein [Bacteriovoracaceae bacterium]
MKIILLATLFITLNAQAAGIVMANFAQAKDSKTMFAAMKIAEGSDGKRIEKSDGTLECYDEGSQKFICGLLLPEKNVKVISKTEVEFSGKIADSIWDNVEGKIIARAGASTLSVANLTCTKMVSPMSTSVKCVAKKLILGGVNL